MPEQASYPQTVLNRLVYLLDEVELFSTQVRVGSMHSHKSAFGVGGKLDAASQDASTVGHAAGLFVGV